VTPAADAASLASLAGHQPDSRSPFTTVTIRAGSLCAAARAITISNSSPGVTSAHKHLRQHTCAASNRNFAGVYLCAFRRSHRACCSSDVTANITVAQLPPLSPRCAIGRYRVTRCTYAKIDVMKKKKILAAKTSYAERAVAAYGFGVGVRAAFAHCFGPAAAHSWISSLSGHHTRIAHFALRHRLSRHRLPFLLSCILLLGNERTCPSAA